MEEILHQSKISPTYPWKIPRTFHQQFMKEFLSLWGFGEVWGIFPGYVGKIIEWCVGQTPSDVWDQFPMYTIFGNLDFFICPLKKSIVTQNEQKSISWLHIRIGFDPFLLDLKIR